MMDPAACALDAASSTSGGGGGAGASSCSNESNESVKLSDAAAAALLQNNSKNSGSNNKTTTTATSSMSLNSLQSNAVFEVTTAAEMSKRIVGSPLTRKEAFSYSATASSSDPAISILNRDNRGQHSPNGGGINRPRRRTIAENCITRKTLLQASTFVPKRKSTCDSIPRKPMKRGSITFMPNTLDENKECCTGEEAEAPHHHHAAPEEDDDDNNNEAEAEGDGIIVNCSSLFNSTESLQPSLLGMLAVPAATNKAKDLMNVSCLTEMTAEDSDANFMSNESLQCSRVTSSSWKLEETAPDHDDFRPRRGNNNKHGGSEKKKEEHEEEEEEADNKAAESASGMLDSFMHSAILDKAARMRLGGGGEQVQQQALTDEGDNDEDESTVDLDVDLIDKYSDGQFQSQETIELPPPEADEDDDDDEGEDGCCFDESTAEILLENDNYSAAKESTTEPSVLSSLNRGPSENSCAEPFGSSFRRGSSKTDWNNESSRFFDDSSSTLLHQVACEVAMKIGGRNTFSQSAPDISSPRTHGDNRRISAANVKSNNCSDAACMIAIKVGSQKAMTPPDLSPKMPNKRMSKKALSVEDAAREIAVKIGSQKALTPPDSPPRLPNKRTSICDLGEDAAARLAVKVGSQKALIPPDTSPKMPNKRVSVCDLSGEDDDEDAACRLAVRVGSQKALAPPPDTSPKMPNKRMSVKQQKQLDLVVVDHPDDDDDDDEHFVAAVRAGSQKALIPPSDSSPRMPCKRGSVIAMPHTPPRLAGNIIIASAEDSTPKKPMKRGSLFIADIPESSIAAVAVAAAPSCCYRPRRMTDIGPNMARATGMSGTTATRRRMTDISPRRPTKRGSVITNTSIIQQLQQQVQMEDTAIAEAAAAAAAAAAGADEDGGPPSPSPQPAASHPELARQDENGEEGDAAAAAAAAAVVADADDASDDDGPENRPSVNVTFSSESLTVDLLQQSAESSAENCLTATELMNVSGLTGEDDPAALEDALLLVSEEECTVDGSGSSCLQLTSTSNSLDEDDESTVAPIDIERDNYSCLAFDQSFLSVDCNANNNDASFAMSCTPSGKTQAQASLQQQQREQAAADAEIDEMVNSVIRSEAAALNDSNRDSRVGQLEEDENSPCEEPSTNDDEDQHGVESASPAPTSNLNKCNIGVGKSNFALLKAKFEQSFAY